MKIFLDIFYYFFLGWGGGGHHRNGLYLGVISMHSGSFLKVKVQTGGYFLGLLKC